MLLGEKAVATSCIPPATAGAAPGPFPLMSIGCDVEPDEEDTMPGGPGPGLPPLPPRAPPLTSPILTFDYAGILGECEYEICKNLIQETGAIRGKEGRAGVVEAGGIYRIQRERHCKIKVSEEHNSLTY